jgi:hypothetical protein
MIKLGQDVNDYIIANKFVVLQCSLLRRPFRAVISRLLIKETRISKVEIYCIGFMLCLIIVVMKYSDLCPSFSTPGSHFLLVC